MKIKTSLVLACLLTTTSAGILAAQPSKKAPKIDVKCHIELLGGQQTIYFATVNGAKLNKLTTSLLKRKVPTIYSDKKQQVYKAFECVPMSEKFSSAHARALFAQQLR